MARELLRFTGVVVPPQQVGWDMYAPGSGEPPVVVVLSLPTGAEVLSNEAVRVTIAEHGDGYQGQPFREVFWWLETPAGPIWLWRNESNQDADPVTYNIVVEAV